MCNLLLHVIITFLKIQKNMQIHTRTKKDMFMVSYIHHVLVQLIQYQKYQLINFHSEIKETKDSG